jgi:hypothetical protein
VTRTCRDRLGCACVRASGTRHRATSGAALGSVQTRPPWRSVTAWSGAWGGRSSVQAPWCARVGEQREHGREERRRERERAEEGDESGGGWLPGIGRGA